jgi:exosortase K
MISNPRFGLGAKIAAILATAFVLKYHYSVASVNELRWILAPTATLVELITGIRFAFEPHAGYMSGDNTFLIAASCAGVNFLIIAFLVLTIGPLWREGAIRSRLVPVALVVSYLVTLFANTTRILVAIFLQRSGMGGEELHRIEGIAVYFLFLIVLFFIAERWRENVWSGLVCLLGIYYSVTLGIPIARGAFLEQTFWKHAVMVGLLPALIVISVAVVMRASHILSLKAKDIKALGEAASAEP